MFSGYCLPDLLPLIFIYLFPSNFQLPFSWFSLLSCPASERQLRLLLLFRLKDRHSSRRSCRICKALWNSSFFPYEHKYFRKAATHRWFIDVLFPCLLFDTLSHVCTAMVNYTDMSSTTHRSGQGFTQRKTNVRHSDQNGQLLGNILSQINPIHIVTHYLEISLNTFAHLPSTPVYPKRMFSY
jgi:hypothetical protein